MAGDESMPEMHLKQPGSTYSACGTFTKNKERIKKFMPTGNTDYIYKNNIDKGCCQHDMACGKYKDLSKRTESDKVLSNRVFEISSNAKYYGYQRGLTPMVYELFDKKSAGSGVNVMPNQQLSNELQKPIIEKF